VVASAGEGGLMADEAIEITSHEQLSGTQRAAVLLMVLDKDSARQVLSHLSVREVEDIGRAIAEIDTVEPTVVETVVGEFVKDLAKSSMMPKTGREFALGVLPALVGGARGDKVGGVLRRAFSNEFQELCASHPSKTLATLLRDEHPQTQAVALLMMGAETAASVLQHYDESMRFELSMRMARLEGVPAAIADDVERALREALDAQSAERFAFEGVDKTARVLGRLGKDDQEPLLGLISDADPDLSDVLRRRMITFDDLTVLDARSVQSLLKHIERQTLIIALRGAEPPLRDLFLKKSQVLLAQEEIVQIVQRLTSEGVVQMYTGGDELV
jgi:flagellar motor switch protein FliG